MLFESWVGALAYTLQLYFDFSGYSDMAIGLSLMFNVRLPMNFNSPYKATSIIEFWRRWHMTLSRFLRDYLYIPLGGSRHGKGRRYVNLMATMLLGGLWHGAGWTFVVWGGLHGFYLMINHAWRNLKQRMGWGDGGRWSDLGAGALTFLAVVVGWVFFRSDNLATALQVLSGMSGLNGFEKLAGAGISDVMKKDGMGLFGTMPLTSLEVLVAIRLLILGLVLSFCFPNACQIARSFQPTLNDSKEYEQSPNSRVAQFQNKLLYLFEFRPTKLQGAGYGFLFFVLLVCVGSATKSEFLYFQF